MPSFEDVITLSDSLSLSSYSSWLLFPPPALVTRYPVPIRNWPVLRERLRRRWRLESCWTLSPVVMISSAAEDSEEEDGLDSISIHDSERRTGPCKLAFMIVDGWAPTFEGVHMVLQNGQGDIPSECWFLEGPEADAVGVILRFWAVPSALLPVCLACCCP